MTLARSHPVARAVNGTQETQDPGAKILVVEDDEDEREALGHLLRLHGYDVELAADGEAALALLSRSTTPPALVVTDISMPVIDGWHFLAAMALDKVWRRLPVVVVSGTVNSEEVPDLPAVAFLSKPLRPRVVVRTVADMLRAAAAEAQASPARLSADEVGPSRMERLLDMVASLVGGGRSEKK